MATITPKEFALRVNSDGRTVRKFLRSDAGMGMRVGKGNRWEIESKSVKSLTSKFSKWNAAQIAAKNAKNAVAETPENELDEN